jgi:putative hemolysin
MESVSVALVLIGLLVLLNAVFSGSELALISLHRGEIERLAQRGRAGRALARLVKDPNRFLATIQLGVTLTGFLASATAAVALAALISRHLAGLGVAAEPVAVVLVTLGLTLVTLVIGELVPKRLALQHPTGWALLVSRPLDALARLTTPVIWLLSRATNACVRLLGGDPKATRHEPTEQQIADLVGSHGVYGHAHRRIITSALTLGQRSLKEVVVPRRDVLALPEDLPADQALRRLVRSGHSRAPVYRDTLDDADRVVGALSAGRQRRGRGRPCPRGAGPAGDPRRRGGPASAAGLTPAAGPGRRRVRRRRGDRDRGGPRRGARGRHLRRARPAAGGARLPRRRGAGAARTVPGARPRAGRRAPDRTLPAATVGGLVSLRLGRLPDPGAVVDLDGYRVTVLSVGGRAVTRLLIEPPVRPATPPDPREPRSAR